MYNKIVDALKGIARDALRMKLVVMWQTRLASANALVNDLTASVLELQKDIARANFGISQLIDADPDKEELTKSYTETIASLNKEIESANQEIVTANKSVTDITAHIQEIQDGKVKVCLDDLNALTEELIMEVTKSVAVSTAASLSVSKKS